MALQRVASEFAYRSGGGGVFYYFTVTLDGSGRAGVRDLQFPYGHPLDPAVSVPASVTDDISIALAQVENLVATTSALNGMLAFSAEVSKAVSFPSAVSGTSYRVLVSVPDFVPYRVVSKTTTGFLIELAAPFTGAVGYDVFL